MIRCDELNDKLAIVNTEIAKVIVNAEELEEGEKSPSFAYMDCIQQGVSQLYGKQDICCDKKKVGKSR